MSLHDELGTRMKEFYEQVPKTKLMRRTPVAIRVDGKAFHTFTRGFERPFDMIMVHAMQSTMKYMCEHIQGCVLGYTQSDEITFILIDYKNLNSDAWFGYEVQKVCSIAAAMATMAFNVYFGFEVSDTFNPNDIFKTHYVKVSDFEEGGCNTLKRGMFDARCFNIPREEVTNLLYWRQLDATRNSIQSVGQYYFSQKELHRKSCNDIQDMLLTQKNINWNDYDTDLKRGSCCVKAVDENGRSKWIVDTEIPIFRGEGREYVERLIRMPE